MSPTERSRRSQDNCQAAPAHHERLDPVSDAGSPGVMSSWTSPNTFLPPVHPPSVSSALDSQDVQRSFETPSVLPLDAQPSRTTQLDSLPLSIPAHLEDRGRPTAVLGSGHKGIDLKAGTSSSRTALGSLSSRLRTSADQGTSMLPRRRRRNPVPQSSNVTRAQSDSALEAFLSSSDDLPTTTSRSSGLPLSQISNLSGVSFAGKGAKTQVVKRISKSMPRSPPSRLVPELLDQASVQSDEASLDEGDLPCTSGKARKGRGANDNRISSRQRDTSSPDCFLPGDSGEHVHDSGSSPLSLTSIFVVSSFGRAPPKWQDHDFEDFVFSIPIDCPTSTPVASRKRASGKCSAGSGATASAGVDPSQE
jgi:hypothetical protein